MKKMLNETPTLKYRVVVEGRTLNESFTQQLAEQFIATLAPEQRTLAEIIPVTGDGKQVLMG
jgi:hypothetical protein